MRPLFTKEGKIKVETFNVELSKIVNNMKLDKLYYPEHEVMISTADLNRPGLQITGFFDYFDPRRIQVSEWSKTPISRHLRPRNAITC